MAPVVQEGNAISDLIANRASTGDLSPRVSDLRLHPRRDRRTSRALRLGPPPNSAATIHRTLEERAQCLARP